ncbi:MAG: hypothetical protein ACON35_01695 [Candidatus Marinamargulisbacteria bacterium]
MSKFNVTIPTVKKTSWGLHVNATAFSSAQRTIPTDRLKKEPVVPPVKKMSWADRVKKSAGEGAQSLKSAGEGADSAYGALEAKLSLGVNEVTTIPMDRLKKESVGTSRVPTVRATVRLNKVGEPKPKNKNPRRKTTAANGRKSKLRNNEYIIQEYLEGKNGKTIRDVLKVTSSLIKTAGQLGDLQHALKQLYNLMRKDIIPDVVTYSAAISACEKAGGADGMNKALALLAEMKQKQLLNSNLGNAKTLDLHEDQFYSSKVWAEMVSKDPTINAHPAGVHSSVARVFLLDCIRQVNLPSFIIVGWHGSGALKNAVQTFLKDNNIGVSSDPSNQGRLLIKQP